MKLLSYLFFLPLALILISCSNHSEDYSENKANEEVKPVSGIAREEVIGKWKLAEESIENNDQGSTSVITSFELKPDSTAIIFHGTQQDKGTWKWKPELEIFGNSMFGFSLKSDVVIFEEKKSNEHSITSLKLDEINEGLPLTFNNRKYQKK